MCVCVRVCVCVSVLLCSIVLLWAKLPEINTMLCYFRVWPLNAMEGGKTYGRVVDEVYALVDDMP